MKTIKALKIAILSYIHFKGWCNKLHITREQASKNESWKTGCPIADRILLELFPPMNCMSIPNCKDCGQPMFLVGGIGKMTQLGEYRKQEGSDMSIWHQTGIKEINIYQCPEDKTIALE